MPQHLGHALIDVGDRAPVVGHPDPFLGPVHQLLEALLALLERLGPLLQPGLPGLVRRRVAQRRAQTRPAAAPWRRGR
jgi:hypothetical protein